MRKSHGPLTARIRAYFDHNVDEVLSFEDVAIKFDCTHKQARDACRELREAGSVITAHVVMRNPGRPAA